MKYQELLHLHGLLAYVREYCETDLNMEVEPSHFEAYEEQGTKAFDLNVQKPDHREAVIRLSSSLINLLEANSDTPLDSLELPSKTEEEQKEDLTDQPKGPRNVPTASANGGKAQEQAVGVTTPSGSLGTDIKDQFTAETNPEATDAGLWDYIDGTEFDPPEYIEAAPREKQVLTASENSDNDEGNDNEENTEQASISNGFS